MSTKPVILFVPGAWSSPEGYVYLCDILTKRGYPTEAVAHPSIGAEPPNKNLYDDVASLKATLTKLADEGKEIVVVAHSYGGMVSSGAVEGVELVQRAKEGKHGGVIMLIYMTAFVIPKGNSLLDMIDGKYLWWMWRKLLFFSVALQEILTIPSSEQDNYCYSSHEDKALFHDLTPLEQERWTKDLQHISAAVFEVPATYEPWHTLPTSFIICEEDQAILLPVQEAMVQALGPQTPVRKLKCSHSPMFVRPEETVDVLVDLVDIAVEKKGILEA
ncbi:MAG: hypothetical protein M1834_008378 [Cirrosporium novae-zelandiae]|nr:MAG: hypothetical protein M1834_008378 [Cirrosporium novae-zelandiae]